MTASGREVSVTDTADKPGQTELSTKAIGRTTGLMETADSLISMVTCTKETGSMIRLTAKAFTPM